MSYLRLTKPFMHGPAVKRLQELCDLFGYDTGDNDGIFGPKTEQSLKQIQTELGVRVDGVYGPETERRARLALVGKFTGSGNAPGVVSIVGDHPRPKNYAGKRSWSIIDGVTLHQTGCSMPSTPAGWARINAHYGLTAGGVPILINDPTDMIWHAQGLSKNTIGVEIAGNYPGIMNRPETLWSGGGPACSLSPVMLQGADMIRNDIEFRFQEAGQVWEFLYAHRQSSDTRRADPGEEIWKQIALRWSRLSGCVIQPQYKRGTGQELPSEWCPDYPGRY